MEKADVENRIAVCHELSAEEYLLDPCGASSLAFWKAGSIRPPAGMLMIRDDQFDAAEYPEYGDAPYFKLVHYMEGIERPALPEGFFKVNAGFEEFSAHIRSCYGGGPSALELAGYAEHAAYDPGLWIALADADGNIAATGIAELDTAVGEGVLEWIQVSKEHRSKGLGEYLVRELLYSLKGRARFTTVSGEVNNSSNPLALYERCGFGGRVIWHVLKEKSQWI